VAEIGGLHRFMAWDAPLLTDGGTWWIQRADPNQPPTEKGEDPDTRSGQRPRITSIDDDGISFTSYVDGARGRLTPEAAIRAQKRFGADLITALDPFCAPVRGQRTAPEVVRRAALWIRRSLDAHEGIDQPMCGALAIDGNDDVALEVARDLGTLPLDGFAVRVAASLPTTDLAPRLNRVARCLPADRPRHLLTSGGPAEILLAIEAGFDLVECTGPARLARQGRLYTPEGILDVRAAEQRDHFGPIDPSCSCATCSQFSRAYLHHLFAARELLAYHLATLHNVAFCTHMVERARAAIRSGNGNNWASSATPKPGRGSGRPTELEPHR
jgi:queuine tRNA-ribosyltransferase